MHKGNAVRSASLGMLTLSPCGKLPAWSWIQALTLTIAPCQTFVHVGYRAVERPDSFKADHNREAVAERVGARNDPVDPFFYIVAVRASVGRVQILAFDAQIVT